MENIIQFGIFIGKLFFSTGYQYRKVETTINHVPMDLTIDSNATDAHRYK